MLNLGLGAIERTSASSGFVSIQQSSSSSYNYSKSSTVCFNATEERKIHTSSMSVEQRSSTTSTTSSQVRYCTIVVYKIDTFHCVDPVHSYASIIPIFFEGVPIPRIYLIHSALLHSLSWQGA